MGACRQKRTRACLRLSESLSSALRVTMLRPLPQTLCSRSLRPEGAEEATSLQAQVAPVSVPRRRRKMRGITSSEELSPIGLLCHHPAAAHVQPSRTEQHPSSGHMSASLRSYSRLGVASTSLRHMHAMHAPPGTSAAWKSAPACGAEPRGAGACRELRRGGWWQASVPPPSCCPPAGPFGPAWMQTPEQTAWRWHACRRQRMWRPMVGQTHRHAQGWIG